MDFNFKVLGFLVVLGSFILVQSCEEGQYECTNKNCIPERWTCDGEDDCGDMSDEPPHGNPDLCPACEEGEYRCANGVCLLLFYVCNGENNCGDGSDEFDDPNQCPACNDNQFRCGEGRCIHESFVCDGDEDCDDGSDEKSENCEVTSKTPLKAGREVYQ